MGYIGRNRMLHTPRGLFSDAPGSGSPERGSFVRKRGGMIAAQRGYAGAN